MSEERSYLSMSESQRDKAVAELVDSLCEGWLHSDNRDKFRVIAAGLLTEGIPLEQVRDYLQLALDAVADEYGG